MQSSLTMIYLSDMPTDFHLRIYVIAKNVKGDFFFVCTAFGTSTPDEVLQEKGLRVPNKFKGAAIDVNRFCIYYVLSWLINNLAKVGYSVDIGGRQPLLEQFESC